jgi:hypothetical protein
MILELYSLLEEAGEYETKQRTCVPDNLAQEAFLYASNLFRTELSFRQQMFCLQGMESSRHKLRLIRTSMGVHVTARQSRELHEGGYGGSHGVLDILNYLSGDNAIFEAINKEKSVEKENGMEIAVNRIGMYLAYAGLAAVDAQMQDKTANPPPLKADRVAEQLPRITHGLHEYVRTRKAELTIDPAVQSALVLAELALNRYLAPVK